MSSSDTKQPIPSHQQTVQMARPLIAGEDYYFEGPVMVFTALYHQRRGYCCGNGCRHCPYPKTDAV
jgi:hypothetical protein